MERDNRIVDRSPEALGAMQARRAELERLRKPELAELHHHYRGEASNGLQAYLAWSKDLLVRAVLEDEGYLWHPGNGDEE